MFCNTRLKACGLPEYPLRGRLDPQKELMHKIIGIVLIKTPAQILQSVLDITARDVEIGLAIRQMPNKDPDPQSQN